MSDNHPSSEAAAPSGFAVAAALAMILNSARVKVETLHAKVMILCGSPLVKPHSTCPLLVVD